ncbi:MAG: hypothetical protein JSV86_12860 [Gemmatimonadota bacterium]|nr:MAG: hypothetical protein JSV86_12860 [Gemmatimonadota bacterium]
MIELVRYIDAPFGTYGELFLPEFSCLTVERPWMDNRPNISCIPPGVYKVSPTMFRGLYKTLEVEGVPGRSLIKIHKANVPDDLRGCIGLGTSWGWLRGSLAVNASASAFNAFWSVWTKESPQHIEIRYKEHPSSLSAEGAGIERMDHDRG